jgi:hypothetical protein
VTRSLLLGAVLMLCAAPANADHPLDTDYLVELMKKTPKRFKAALDKAKAEEHRIQFLVSFVRQKNGKPVLERHGFRVDAEYFYPASAVKTCAAVASMMRLAPIKGAGLHTPLVFHPVLPGERRESEDATNIEGGKITLGHIIRQMSLISSNKAFNRLYEFAGHQFLNEAMWAAGLKDTRFIHRLSRRLTPEENRKTPKIELRGRKKITWPAQTSPLDLKNEGLKGLKIGDAHIIPGTREKADEPMDFARKNRQTLVDLQNMLVMIVRPDIDLGLPGFDLLPHHRRFLKTAMLQWPEDSKNPITPAKKYNPFRFKPVLPGLLKVAPKTRWHVYNKAGKAYGFRVENAYIIDRRTKKSVFITAAIYANPNKVVNDGKYAYNRLADPLIHALTRAVVKDAKFKQ